MSKHIPEQLLQKLELFQAVFSPAEFYIMLPTLVHQLGGIVDQLHQALQENTYDERGKEINEESYRMIQRWIKDVSHRLSEIKEKESEGV